MRKIVFVASFCFLCSSMPASVQPSTAAYTLDQCLGLARQQSDDLKIQSERLIQSQQQLKAARGAIFPQLNYMWNKTYQDTANGEFPADQSNSFLNLNWTLFAGFRDWQALSVFDAAIKSQKLIYDDMARNLNATVTESFFTIVQIEADDTNLSESIKLLQDRFTELNDRVRLGKSRDSEVLAVQSQIASLFAQEQQDAGSRSDAIETLSFLTGVDSAGLEVIDNVTAVQRLDPLDKYLESAKNRPDVAALRQNIIAEEHSVNLQKGAFLPTVGLDGDYYLQRSGSSADSKWAAVLSLDFPIFQGGSTLAQVRLEQSRLRQTQQLLEQALRQLNTQVKSLYKSLDFSIRQAAAYQDAYTKAQKSYLAQLRDYRFGLVTNLDVIQAMLDMLASKRNFDRAVIQVKIDKSLLDIAAMQ